MRSLWPLWLCVGAMLVALALSFCTPADAHDAPSGWSYPFSCCSCVDCREVDGPDAVRMSHKVQIGRTGDRYVISTTGEAIAETDARVKDSPDGAWHWCSQGGRDDGRTICLFRPPNMF